MYIPKHPDTKVSTRDEQSKSKTPLLCIKRIPIAGNQYEYPDYTCSTQMLLIGNKSELGSAVNVVREVSHFPNWPAFARMGTNPARFHLQGCVFM